MTTALTAAPGGLARWIGEPERGRTKARQARDGRTAPFADLREPSDVDSRRPRDGVRSRGAALAGPRARGARRALRELRGRGRGGGRGGGPARVASTARGVARG